MLQGDERAEERAPGGEALGAVDGVEHPDKLGPGALAAILGDKPWFFGDDPTETDAVAYGQLANIYSVGFASPMKAVIAEHANLTSFIERFAARYYP